MKKILLITISLSIAYWGVLLAVEYSWTLPIPFLIVAYMWLYFLSPEKPKYKIIKANDKYGILRTSDRKMLVVVSDSLTNYWKEYKHEQAQYCYTVDKEKVERYLEQLNSN
jgi:hypothetical protein